MISRAASVLVLALAVAGGCGKKRDLVIVDLTASPALTGSTTVTVAVGGASQMFTVAGVGDTTAVSLGVYVPAGTSGATKVSASARDGQGCVAASDEMSVDLAGSGQTYHVHLTLRSMGCADGGAADAAPTSDAAPAADGAGRDAGAPPDAATSDGPAPDLAGPPPSDAAPPQDTAPAPPDADSFGAPSLTKCTEVLQDTMDACLQQQFTVRRVAFSRDGKRLATADDTGRVKFWNVDGAAITAAGVELQENNLGHVVFSTDGTALATGGFSVDAWSVPGAMRLFSVPTVVQGIDFIGFSGDNDRFATHETEDTTIRLWSLSKKGMTGSFPMFDSIGTMAQSAAPPASGAWWVAMKVGDRNGVSQVAFMDLDMATAKPTTAFDATTFDILLALSNDTNLLAIGGAANLTLWDSTDKTHPVALAPPLITSPTRLFFESEGMSFSPSGHHLVVSLDDVLLYSVDRRAKVASLTPRAAPWTVAFSPDGRSVAVAGEKCMILLCRD